MPALLYSPARGCFYWAGGFEDRTLPQSAGFDWDDQAKVWWTASPFVAFPLHAYARDEARARLDVLADGIRRSGAPAYSGPPLPAPSGLAYRPFQAAGIDYVRRLRVSLLGDEMGLGKTIQAIGQANVLGARRLLVICPATLQVNWRREIEKWHVHNAGVEIVNTEDRAWRYASSVIISYDMAVRLGHVLRLCGGFDHLIVDEAHYVKNMGAQRTRVVLGFGKTPGLAHQIPVVTFLSGSPLPNNLLELFPLLKRTRPDLIDDMSEAAFIRRFMFEEQGEYGRRVFGARNTEELHHRLRSGFMVRRLKRDVLQDLPPKQYHLVVFPADAGTARVLEKEKPFDAAEIIAHGVPAGSPLPEVRREMGVAKAPAAARYIEDALEGGLNKVVVFAYHVEVIRLLTEALAAYRPAVVFGATPPEQRQPLADRFQTDPECRVFIGQIRAAGVGLNLTAASDVIMAEASWVPEENSQCADRCHRIGQRDSVTVHLLVVEGSLDARILAAGARKQTAISAVLDGEGVL